MGAVLHYFLVYFPAKKRPKRKARYEWKSLEEMANGTAEVQAALQTLPDRLRGDDPDGNGWVVLIDDFIVDGSEKRFRTMWYTWGSRSVPLGFRREWRLYTDFVNPRLADEYERSVRAEAGLEEQESDEEADAPAAAAVVPTFFNETQGEGSQRDADGDVVADRTAKAPSSLRWDPVKGAARLSLRAAVRNHSGKEGWTIPMLRAYTLTRMFVLRSRVPPPEGAVGAPTGPELEQMAKDLFRVNESTLTSKWKRARTTAANQRAFRAAERADEEDEDDEEDDEEGDEDDLYARDPLEAEKQWRERTERSLRLEAVGRWAASRTAVDREMGKLADQLRALDVISNASGRDGVDVDTLTTTETAGVVELVTRWKDDKDRWTAVFSSPRLKNPQISTYLSETRSERARAWLALQREAHSEANGVERATGVMGDAYSPTWPFAGVPTAVQAPGDHAVARECFSPNTNIILENGDAAQNVMNIVISTLESNSSKGSKSIGLFSTPSEQKSGAAFAPGLVSDAKIAMLAKVVAGVFSSYIGVSNTGKSTKGVASLQRSSGDAVFARAFEQNNFSKWLLVPASAWERRMALLTLGIAEFQVGNPFVLYGPSTVTPELLDLLHSRFRGDTDPVLKLCDEALRDSVLRAPG
jgi:hypothetical protein